MVSKASAPTVVLIEATFGTDVADTCTPLPTFVRQSLLVLTLFHGLVACLGCTAGPVAQIPGNCTASSQELNSFDIVG